MSQLRALDMTLDELETNYVNRTRRFNSSRRYNNHYNSNHHSPSKRRRYNNNSYNNNSYNNDNRHDYDNNGHHYYYENDYHYNEYEQSQHSYIANNNNNNHHFTTRKGANAITTRDAAAYPYTFTQLENDDDDDDLLYHSLQYNDGNNNGWRKGWCLDEEFKKQSANIRVSALNKPFITKRCIDNFYPKEKYRRRKGEDKKHIIHWGQRKLLLSEIEFLSKYLQEAKKGEDGFVLVIYAGAAPGKHIPLLIEMFDDIRMELFDPNDFNNVVQNKARINVHQQYFTDEIAQEFGAIGRDILFISDIRTADHRRQSGEECEATIMKDNELQSNWVRAMNKNQNLIAAMLKFRLPYPHLVQSRDHKQICLNGTVYTQCFAPVTSTETRLHIIPDEKGRIEDKYYDCVDYEQQLFWFNTKARQSFIDNAKYYAPKIGVINNYDCFTECKILEEYCKNYVIIKGSTVKKHHVIHLVNKITKFIGNKRCLLTKPADPHEQKKGLAMVNHSHFHENQHIANPMKVKIDPHHLYGYEGLLGIDPNDKPQINEMIMNSFVENGYDTNTIKQFDDMLNITRADCNINENNNNKYCIIPSYNRPLYHLISMDNNEIYVIPLNGFSAMWFKIDANYLQFYRKCFFNHDSFCVLTGFLVDNHKVSNSNASMRYTFAAIDILTKHNNDNNNNYKERRKLIQNIVDNYEKFKHEVTQRDIFKFIPLKIEVIPSAFGVSQSMKFRKQRIKQFNIGNYDDETWYAHNTEDNNKVIKWNDIHFDAKEHETPPNGYYLDKVALNTRIGGCLSINIEQENIMIANTKFIKI